MERSVYWPELVRWGCSATTEPEVPERRRRPQGIRRWSRGNGKGVTARAAGGVIRTSVWRPFTDLGNMEISLGTMLDFCVEIGACGTLQWSASEARERGWGQLGCEGQLHQVCR